MKDVITASKLLYILGLITIFTTTTRAGKFDQLAECMLSVTSHELAYVPLTNTMQWNATFQSNCMDYLHHAYFVIPFSKFYEQLFEMHPSKVVVDFAGQNYVFQFMDIDEQGSKQLYFFFL